MQTFVVIIVAVPLHQGTLNAYILLRILSQYLLGEGCLKDLVVGIVSNLGTGGSTVRTGLVEGGSQESDQISPGVLGGWVMKVLYGVCQHRLVQGCLASVGIAFTGSVGQLPGFDDAVVAQEEELGSVERQNPQLVTGEALGLQDFQQVGKPERVVHGDTEINVTIVTRTTVFEQGTGRTGTSMRSRPESRIVETVGEGIVERIKGLPRGDLDDRARADVVVRVEAKVHRLHLAANDGVLGVAGHGSQ